MVMLACAPRVQPGGARAQPSAPRRTDQTATVLDPSNAYRRAGLVVQGAPLPFVGMVRYLGGRVPDSTLVLVALSLANRSLTFVSEGVTQRAEYAVVLDFQRDGASVERVEARETVRVSSFKETTRAEETIVFQRLAMVPPGAYTLAITVRDEGGTNTAAQQVPVTVPQLTAQTLSSPIVVYRASSRASVDAVPSLIANPRSTVVFGRDSLVPVYLEGYGLAADTHIVVGVLDEERRVVMQDTVTLASRGSLSSKVLSFRIPQLGVGELTVTASLVGGGEPVSAPILVSFGEQLGIISFDELLSYLRYYAAPERLAPLRDSVPERRAAVWAAFWKSTDPIPATPEHEGLRDYFARVQAANLRFREEGGEGWLTDRGKVYITLGEPDQLMEQGGPGVGARGRVEVWEYAKYHVQLVFVDQTGFGQWRLTPASEADYRQIEQRELVH
jgi:GWxTD domain-containing protein